MNLVHKDFGGRQVVWLPEMNRYIQLEMPAWEVVEGHIRGDSREQLIHQMVNDYELSPKQASEFVSGVWKEFSELVHANVETKSLERVENRELPCPESYFSSFTYRIGESIFSFSYQSLQMEFFIHPLLECHVVGEQRKGKHTHFELREHNGWSNLLKNGSLIGAWPVEDNHLLKGKIFLQLLEELYGVKEEEWMAGLHASAVSDGKSAVLFSAASGSGKSTFAGLLRAHGFQLVSDDFVPVERKSKLVYALPTAASVKEGAWKLLETYFPELRDSKTIRYDALDKTVRFLSPGDFSELGTRCYPAKALVFVKYNAEVGIRFEKMDVLEAMNLLFDESWIPAYEENVRAFFDWFAELECYQLEYGDTPAAIQRIRELFHA